MRDSLPLVAICRPLPAGIPVDPYVLAGTSGIVFDTGSRLLVGVGSALTIPLARGLDSPSDLDGVRHVLASIPCDDESGRDGSRIMAFAALPFDRSESTALVVPEMIYCRDADGSEWATVIGRSGHGDLWGAGMARALLPPSTGLNPIDIDGRAMGSQGRPDGRAVIEPLSSDADFLESVAQAVDSIDRGELSKVVLARHIEVRLGQPIHLPSLLTRWRAMEPNCTVFSMPTPSGRFVGASPELLVERRGALVRSRPLAGSTGETSDDDTAEFRSSSKEILEHRLVTDAVGQALAPLCSALEVPPVPDLVRLYGIVHLGTDIRGVLRRRPERHEEADGIPTALDLVAVLHPTPAVGGVPTAVAVDAIAQLEPERRGPYAGPVGYVDGNGNGQWVVGIRAASLRGRTARMVAGVGVVSGSKPAAELSETMIKFSTVFHALVPDQPFTTAPGRDDVAGPSRQVG
ncbi:MAG: isochorismate synthase [Acidimicrobiales bacterium]